MSWALWVCTMLITIHSCHQKFLRVAMFLGDSLLLFSVLGLSVWSLSSPKYAWKNCCRDDDLYLSEGHYNSFVSGQYFPCGRIRDSSSRAKQGCRERSIWARLGTQRNLFRFPVTTVPLQPLCLYRESIGLFVTGLFSSSLRPLSIPETRVWYLQG